ncbi:F-box DNA helicase 1 [Amphiprion ocellaris]|uniref:DNA 3'-5' helicase n=1 Tax=Amphiprion ocellaris TaxID=80972 RepID=A0A3Q1D6B6_AMPOC|nr:F-box DNA helicase 1 [Amphiprion ocellaris]
MEVAVKGKAKRRHLNAEECDELGQSTRGTDVLSRPHTSNQGWGNRDPNRGLYPRTPPKRWKWAPASGSPTGKQKGISDFFSVTGVVSSSPRKSSLPCTSTSPKEEPRVLKEEEEEEEEDDDDDVNLLAVPLAPEPKVKMEEESDDDSLLAAIVMPEPEEDEDEIDDVSLLAGTMESEPKPKEEDYLEGITAEMFADDDEFDQCEEEEVEALPDAHYGLLGSSNLLLQPQGSMDDLPEEVLRQILSLIPAQDLYRTASQVCHRWTNIVHDTKFVPFKKQYYRYMMQETDTVLEISSILKNSGVTEKASSHDSIRKLVVLMAQHNVGERVNPVDILERVKKHRLFPQAEASIRLLIPDIQKCFNLGIEGPNPYAAMAIILILSESVGDVQALVSLLTGSMSHIAITEYLSHMAMMLLSLERSNIRISNRLHYNIYYVLHLMENGPFSVSSGQSRQAQIHLTREQQQVLCHDIQTDHVVKIVAFAGTGKTTTLVKYAEQRPHLRFLYVAFNNSVACEARRRFPSNVDSKTVHSLAYSDIGRRYKLYGKLTSNLKPFTVNSVLPKGRGGFGNAKVVTTTLNTFMASPDETITTRHVPNRYISHSGSEKIISIDDQRLFVQDAQVIWDKMKELKKTSQHGFYMPHDGYLKLWQLQNPCLSDKYDAIFIDEAQDCTPVVMDVLLSQRCGKILVGDPHQQIYTFRGAVNALDMVDHTHIYYLTQSFRFGPEIAYVGATILKVCKQVQKILVGGTQKGGVCDETAERTLQAVMMGTSHSRGKTAILSRCNLGVFREAVRLTNANRNVRIHFIGDVKNIGLDRILDIWHLMQQTEQEIPQSRAIKDPFFRNFAKAKKNAFWALKSYVTQTEDKELEGKVNIVEQYRSHIPQLVVRLKKCHESDYHNADFMLGTVHKAKGLEFDTVIVTDDFSKVPAARHNLHHTPGFKFWDIPHDEWNLLYVAVTRARTSLVISKTIYHILTMAGEYFLKSEMPSPQLTAGGPPPCSVSNCPNCITPSSAFVMREQHMKCTDGVLPGGLLCERCVWTRIGPTAFLMTDGVLSMAETPQRLGPPFHHIVFIGLL